MKLDTPYGTTERQQIKRQQIKRQLVLMLLAAIATLEGVYLVRQLWPQPDLRVPLAFAELGGWLCKPHRGLKHTPIALPEPKRFRFECMDGTAIETSVWFR